MSHTSRATIVASAIIDKLTQSMGTLGLASILYGSHNMIPHPPCAVVYLGVKTRELAGVAGPGGRTMNNIPIYVDIIDAKVGDETANRMSIDRIAEEVEILLHQDTTLGGIIIHGFVQQMDPGETIIQNSYFRTVRMLYNAITKTNLPN